VALFILLVIDPVAVSTPASQIRFLIILSILVQMGAVQLNRLTGKFAYGALDLQAVLALPAVGVIEFLQLMKRRREILLFRRGYFYHSL